MSAVSASQESAEPVLAEVDRTFVVAIPLLALTVVTGLPAMAGTWALIGAIRALPKLVRRTLPMSVALEIRADHDAWVGIAANDLTRICANLVFNANDAITGKGTIAVRVTRDDARVVIDVQDDGAGMPGDVLSHLFEPFFTTKPVGRGTGLGLATARILVERAAGTIEVQSDVGHGTRFTIRLPVIA